MTKCKCCGKENDGSLGKWDTIFLLGLLIVPIVSIIIIKIFVVA